MWGTKGAGRPLEVTARLSCVTNYLTFELDPDDFVVIR